MAVRVEAADTSEIAGFLAGFPPFDALATAELEEIAAAVQVRRYGAGDNVLVEDAQPAEHLFVVRSGSVELLHEEEVVDVLEPGESFGHPSLLTGLAPAFTVRAHEDSAIYLIPRDQALRVLGGPGGIGYVATTLRDRLARTGHVVHALPQVSTVAVRELLGRPAVFCEPGTTISHAARLMTENNVSAILTRDGRQISIVTDAALRVRVIAGGLSPENPVSRVAVPAVVVPPEYLAVDAVVDMLDAGTDHVVVVDERANVLGMLAASDLLGLESRSPFALRHAMLRAQDEDELVARAGQLRQLLLALLDAGAPPDRIGRVLSLQADTLATRLIDFAIARYGGAPSAWAWLQFGSAARREFTLGSDQENGLAYAGRVDSDVDAYFERLASDVNDGLARCGFAPDANGVLARNALWRLPDAEWLRVFEDVLESPDESHLIRATVAFDFRHVAGGLEIVPPLVAVVRRAPKYPTFVKQLARSAAAFKPPLGFRGSITVAREGEATGRLDIKRGGAIPIANLARFYAVTNGITIASTLDRLVAAQEVGALDADTATGLREAFAVVARIRLAHHASLVEAGLPTDNLIEPSSLAPLARQELREAFRIIAQAQKRLSAYVPVGL